MLKIQIISDGKITTIFSITQYVKTRKMHFFLIFAKKMQRIVQKNGFFFGYLQKKRYLCTRIRKDAGVVDRAALEMRCTGNCTGGSNPSLSANDKKERGLQISLFFY